MRRLLSTSIIRRCLAEEDGIALLVAVIILSVVLLTVAAAGALSTETSQVAGREALEQEAIQAAQTGLRMGVYETNSLGLDVGSLINPLLSATGNILPGQCVAQVNAQLNQINTPVLGTVTSVLSGGVPINIGGTYCPPVRETLGNGETLCYQMSPLAVINVSTGNLVSGNNLNLSSALSLKLNREIVASGTAGGVTRYAYEVLQDPVTTALGSLLGNLLGSGTLNVQLYKPVSGTYGEGKPSFATITC